METTKRMRQVERALGLFIGDVETHECDTYANAFSVGHEVIYHFTHEELNNLTLQEEGQLVECYERVYRTKTSVIYQM